jgi:hypothetical protein
MPNWSNPTSLLEECVCHDVYGPGALASEEKDARVELQLHMTPESPELSQSTTWSELKK